MNGRFPRWFIWTGLSLGIWALWAILVYGGLARQIHGLQTENEASSKKLATLQAKLSSVPALVARLDSLQHDLHGGFGLYANASDLDGLMEDLNSAARRHGITNSMAAPDLESLLQLDVTRTDVSVDDIRCDTLLVEIAALNDFRRIGRWLDGIEQRVYFQRWVECRWSETGESELTRFTGLVALLVTNKSAQVAEVAGASDGR